MKYIIIGTAGHVDHGKTALIRALTGMDTDRLKEEKERGISIDLGFAFIRLSDDIAAGIVDVPGHERFLKNMLAGTGGIDLAMLTVAADEGVMPQTREHLAMLQLYGVKHGLVVINKVDKVDNEWLAMIEEEMNEFLRGSFLQGAPVCQVSALTGEGVPELKKKLWQVAQKMPARDTQAPFRLWIDRVFTVKGHGIVVTGSALSGKLKAGDTLVLYPKGHTVRVRGLETHGEKTGQICAGQRSAINLTGVELDAVKRGMLLSDTARGQVSSIWDVAVDWRQPVEGGCRVRLHLGTGEFIGRIYKPKLSPEGQYRIALENPVGAGAGDRGILRMYSPQYLLGGVMLLGAAENNKKYPDRRPLRDAFAQSNAETVVRTILDWQRQPVLMEEIKRMGGYMTDQSLEEGIKRLLNKGEVITLERYYIRRDRLDEISANTRKILGEYHQHNENRFGVVKEELRQKLEIDDHVFEAVFNRLLEDGIITMQGAEAALPWHAEKHKGRQMNIVEEAEQKLGDVGLTDINTMLIGEKYNMPVAKAQRFFDELVKAGILVRVGDIHVYRKTIQYIVNVIHSHFKSKKTLSVAELRDILNTSRKFALPLLEYMDMNKYTIREGDLRRPGPKLKDLSEKTLF